MKITFNKRIDDHQIFISRTVQGYSPESSDGYIRGFSTSETERYNLTFSNEKKENEGYSYDMEIIALEWGGSRMLTEEEFKKDFTFFFSRISSKLYVKIINFKTFIMVSYNTERCEECDLLKVYYSPKRYLFEGEKLENYELIKNLPNEKSPEGKRYLIARAIGDRNFKKGELRIDTDFVPEELIDEIEELKLEKVNLHQLVATGKISKEEITEYFRNLFSLENSFAFYSQGIEKYLPEEMKREFCRRVYQTSDNLNLFRTYAPEIINWDNLSKEDFRKSDVDLILQRKYRIDSRAGFEFIQDCLTDKALRDKILSNVTTIIRNEFKLMELLSLIKDDNGSKIKFFHSIIDRCEKLDKVYTSDIRGSLLSRFTFEGASKKDFEDFINLVSRIKDIKYPEARNYAEFIFMIADSAGVSQEEIFKVFQTEAFLRIPFPFETMKELYQKYDSKLGLAWVEQEEKRFEEEMKARKEEELASHEAVVQFVKNSDKIAVRVSIDSSNEVSYLSSSRYKKIGTLLPEENRVVVIQEDSYYRTYILVDVERAKKLKNGVLHIDILESCMASIIGPKGENIKKIKNKLNQLGCNLKLIKLHAKSKKELGGYF